MPESPSPSLSGLPRPQNGRKRLIIRLGGVSLPALLLAACGGEGARLAAPVVKSLNPNFTESPTNTFTAGDDADHTLSEGNSTADLTVIGKAGDDSITTGSGNDLIRPGEGRDVVNAGAGDDIIVVVGTTAAGQYTDASITSPAGTGFDLSAVLDLASLNDRSVSEVVSGEIIDGGAGTDVLVIFGTVDLSDMTLVNLSQLWVNSDLTLTGEQLAGFTSVQGDGNSILRLVVGDSTAPIDMGAIVFEGIGTVYVGDGVTLTLTGTGDLQGISTITGTGETGFSIVINAPDGGSLTLTASDLQFMMNGVGNIELGANVTLNVDSLAAFQELGVLSVSGPGTLVIDEVVLGAVDAAQALAQLNADSTATTSYLTASSGSIEIILASADGGAVSGSDGSDVILGQDGADDISAGGGDDTIVGGGGDDGHRGQGLAHRSQKPHQRDRQSGSCGDGRRCDTAGHADC